MTPAEIRKEFDPLAAKTIETVLAAPQVITRRLTRMALAGHNPSRRDIREFNRMILEKTEVFYESWNAMLLQIMRVQQGIWQANIEMFSRPWWMMGSTPPDFSAPFDMFGLGMLGVWQQGLNPVHKRVVANARRFSRH